MAGRKAKAVSSATGGLGGVLRGMAMPIIAGSMAVGTVAPIVGGVRKSKQINASRANLKNFNPQLEDVDENTINNYFDVIRTFSPSAASNPIVAGNIVNKMVEFGGVDHNLVKSLVDIEEKGAKVKGYNLGTIKDFAVHSAGPALHA